MNLFSYRLLIYLALPFIAYLGWKRCTKYAQQKSTNTLDITDCFRSRFGFNRKKFQTGGIWIHAVSIGETRSIFSLLRRLKEVYPEQPITLTNGSTQAALQALQFAPVKVQHQMIPYDYSFAINRFLDQIQPKLVMIIETEIWPNLYQACAKRNIPLVLINARLKEKSFLAYQKWGGTMLRNALNQTQFIASQFAIDTEYFIKLGIAPQKIKTLGNIKFDLDISPSLVNQVLKWKKQHTLEKRFIWVAASTHAHPEANHDSEELLILQAHKAFIQQVVSQVDNPKQAQPLLILVPRHIDRFDEVALQIENTGLSYVRRSQNQPITTDTQVYLADSVGELMLWFASCNLAFIGGSLVPFGGHNILEPAALHKAIISGPHCANLQALYNTFSQNNALTIVENTEALTRTLVDLSSYPKKCRALGDKAFHNFNQHSGTLDKVLNEIKPFLD